MTTVVYCHKNTFNVCKGISDLYVPDFRNRNIYLRSIITLVIFILIRSCINCKKFMMLKITISCYWIATFNTCPIRKYYSLSIVFITLTAYSCNWIAYDIYFHKFLRWNFWIVYTMIGSSIILVPRSRANVAEWDT